MSHIFDKLDLPISGSGGTSSVSFVNNPKSVAAQFSASVGYTKGQLVYYDNALYRFTADHAAGAWNSGHVTAVTVAGELKAAQEEVADLKEDLSDLRLTITDMLPIPMQDGFIDIKANGVVTDLTPVEMSGCRYAIVPCQAGDLFIVNAHVESGKKCAGFLSANGTGLSINGYRGTMDSPFVAPANSAYLVINSINADYVSYRYSPDKSKPIPMHHVQISESGSSRFINCNVTNIDLNTYIEGSTYVRTTVVPCAEGDKFIINARGGAYPRPWTFIDASWTRISVADGAVAYTDYELTAPANSAYLIINDFDFQKSYYGTLADVVVTHADTGNLDDLTTTDKTNLVSSINEVKESVDAIGDISGLESAFMAGVNNGRLPIVMQDGYVEINAVGSVTDITPTTKSGCRYAVVPCAEGDMFIINALVESGHKCAGFLSADYVGLAVCGYRGTMDSPFVAPANSAYLVFNSINSEYSSYKYIPDKNDPIPMRHIQINANGASRFINLNVSKINFVEFIEGVPYIRTGVVPCTEGDKFVINARGGNYARPWAFVDAGWNRISVADGSVSYNNYELTAPANSAYLVINDYDYQKSYFGALADVVATHGETGDLAGLTTEVRSTLVSAINEVNGVATETRNALSNPVITDWTSGGYISTGESDANPVDVATMHTNASYRYKILECAEGDVFILNTIGGGYPRAYAFLDSNNYIISRSDNGAGLDGFVATAPANTAKLVLNDKGGKDSYYGEPSIGYKVDALEGMGLVPAKLNGKIMVNFGDSIWGMGQGAVGISGQLAQKTGATVHNCGMNDTKMSDTGNRPYFDVFCLANLVDAIVSGDYTTQDYQIQNDPTNIPPQAPNVIADLKTLDFSTVDYVTISLGTNDWAANQQLDNAQNTKDKSCIGSALRYSIEKILTAFPQALIVIISTTYRAKKVSGSWVDVGANTAGYTLQDINQKYAEIADEYHLKFIDDYNIGLNNYTTEVYTTDGLHPNVGGWEFIAENISSHL